MEPCRLWLRKQRHRKTLLACQLRHGQILIKRTFTGIQALVCQMVKLWLQLMKNIIIMLQETILFMCMLKPKMVKRLDTILVNMLSTISRQRLVCQQAIKGLAFMVWLFQAFIQVERWNMPFGLIRMDKMMSSGMMLRHQEQPQQASLMWQTILEQERTMFMFISMIMVKCTSWRLLILPLNVQIIVLLITTNVMAVGVVITMVTTLWHLQAASQLALPWSSPL